MKLKSQIIGLETGGKPIVVLNKEDADDLGVRSLSRVKIFYSKKELTAIVNVSEKLVKKGFIGISEEVKSFFNIRDNVDLEVEVAKLPNSLQFIKNRLNGKRLTYEELYSIVKDVVEGNLTEIEIASFITSLHNFNLDIEEAFALSLAMVETGEKLELNKKFICDKHSVSYETPILIKEDGIIKVVKIGEFVDKIIENSKNVLNFPDGSQYCELYGKYEVPAFDEELNVNFRKVTGVYRHPSPKKMIRITLLGNRQVDVTESHSVFRLKDGRLESVPTKEIKVGDYLAVPRKIIENSVIEEIDLINELLKLPFEETSHIYIVGLKKFPLIKKHLTVSQKVNDLTPLNLLRKIKLNFPKEKVKLKIKHGKPINALIKVNKEFVRFLGYYISEGFINENGIFIDFGSHERELIEDVRKCVKNVFGINLTKTLPHKTAVHLCIYNKLLGFIFEKIFKLGKNSYEKEIPSMIFNIPVELQLEFLMAYFHGDGYFRRGYEAIANTVSKKLVTGLSYLLSNLSISFSISKKPESYRNFPHHISKTKESFFIYTQANRLLGKESNTAAYLNFIPIRESNLFLLAHNPLIKGWENRRVLRRQKYITFKKMKKLLQNYIDTEKATEEDIKILKELKNIIKGEIGFLPVKRIEEVNTNSKYVYDLCVKGYENFVGGNGPIFLHNSIGGIPGDKTSLILVPIIASLGLTIPKTSSRAITSAGGTADKAECLMPVDLDLDEMKRVVEKTNGCIVWGGNLHLAPADDIFIRIEYPLSIDPLLLPSIMSKKKAVGSTHLVVDIPTGRGTKVKTIGEANFLARDFIQLGKKLGIKVNCAITYGEQPIGYNIGPSLEAREALEVVSGKKIYDLIDKVTNIAGILLEMVGKKNGKDLALNVLNSGKAKRKLMEIISEQGGNDKIKPEDIPIGNKTYDIISPKNGYVLWINNFDLVEVARAAGAPKDKGAGIRLYKKLNDNVRKGEKILTIFSEKGEKLERAIKLFEDLNAIGIGEKIEMLIHKVEEIRETKKSFILER
jgi:thymidine phosphorylase/intein/homing endonuclease